MTCTPIYTAALFTIAKIKKQSKCPLIDEWIRMCGIHDGILLSHKKRPATCDNMDLEVIMLSDLSQAKEDIQYDSPICGI